MSEQKAAKFIPKQYTNLETEISSRAKDTAYDLGSFKRDLKSFILKADLLYIDVEILSDVLLNSTDVNIKKFTEHIKQQHPLGFSSFLATTMNLKGKEIHEKLCINVPNLRDIVTGYPKEEIVDTVFPLIKEFYNRSQRVLKQEEEYAILRQFIKNFLPDNHGDQEYYFKQLSPYIDKAIEKQKATETAALSDVSDTDQLLSEEELLLVRRRHLEKYPQRFSEEAQGPKTPLSFCSSFWSFVNNPKSDKGKLARNTFEDLLRADLAITWLGGLYYLIHPSTALKLSAEIIPPTILFISIIILLAGFYAERKELAKVWEAQDAHQQNGDHQSAVPEAS